MWGTIQTRKCYYRSVYPIPEPSSNTKHFFIYPIHIIFLSRLLSSNFLPQQLSPLLSPCLLNSASTCSLVRCPSQHRFKSHLRSDHQQLGLHSLFLISYLKFDFASLSSLCIYLSGLCPHSLGQKGYLRIFYHVRVHRVRLDLLSNPLSYLLTH